jgi:hypothetical protein
MKQLLSRQNSLPFVAKFLLLHYYMSVPVTARALVDESGIIKTLMGMHNRSEIMAMHGRSSAIPPLNSNINASSHLCLRL